MLKQDCKILFESVPLSPFPVLATQSLPAELTSSGGVPTSSLLLLEPWARRPSLPDQRELDAKAQRLINEKQRSLPAMTEAPSSLSFESSTSAATTIACEHTPMRPAPQPRQQCLVGAASPNPRFVKRGTCYPMTWPTTRTRIRRQI